MNNNDDAIELSVVEGPTSGLFKITETGLQIAEDVSYEQWREILRTLKLARNKTDIWTADCIRFGNGKFGADKVSECLEQLEFEAVAVKTAIAINSVPDELRLPFLKGEHFVEISRANLPREEQLHWGMLANDRRLTPSQLRLSIKEGEVIDTAAARALNTGVITIQGINQMFQVWQRRVGGLRGIHAMDREHQEDIIGELNEMVDFGLALRKHLEVLEAVV